MIIHRICCKLVELYAYAFIIATALAIAIGFTLKQYLLIVGIFYLIDRTMYLFGHGSTADIGIVSLVASLTAASIGIIFNKSLVAVFIVSVVVFIVTIWIQSLIIPIRQNLSCLK